MDTITDQQKCDLNENVKADIESNIAESKKESEAERMAAIERRRKHQVAEKYNKLAKIGLTYEGIADKVADVRVHEKRKKSAKKLKAFKRRVVTMYRKQGIKGVRHYINSKKIYSKDTE